MALNGTQLGTEIEDEIKAVFLPLLGPQATPELLTKFCKAVGEKIVAHIVANAVVQPGTFANGFGPVTGTGTIT